MNDKPYNKLDGNVVRPRTWTSLVPLLCLHTIMCCISLVFVSGQINYPKTAPIYDSSAHFIGAGLNAASFAPVALFFILGRFSFGYLLGFYFYTMILGYLWLLAFSDYRYDHALAQISIFVSAWAFLAPAMLINSPITQRFVLSARALDLLLSFILLLAAATVAVGVSYNFKLVGLSDIYKFRDEIAFPGFLRYAIGIVSNALLPFAYACFIALGKPWRAGATLLLLLLFYPVTLTKITLFAPCWLLFLTLLSQRFRARSAVVLSLLLPLTFGVALVLLLDSHLLPAKLIWDYFGTVNIRMIAIPSIALDVYNDFFATHRLTYFCQISVLKPFIDCPYAEPLSVVMLNAYALGNFNASLFATEGIASVGPLFAPISALVCGLVIAFANRLSSGLPSVFILLSGGLVPQIFLNAPFTTTLLTNGAAILFLLWYVTPRSIAERTPHT